MADSRYPLHHANAPIEDRFLSWVDTLVDTRSLPATGAPPSPDPDFAELARTATVVQQSAGTAMSLRNDQTEAMWKEIMNTTTTPPTISPIPTEGATPPSSGGSRLPTMPSLGWQSYLATAALIAVILIAGVATIWRIADPQFGSDPGPAHQPGIIGPATPAAESLDGCPLTNDMLVFVGEVPESIA